MICDANVLRIFITANDWIIEIEALTLNYTITKGYGARILTVKSVQTTKELSITRTFQSVTHKR